MVDLSQSVPGPLFEAILLCVRQAVILSGLDGRISFAGPSVPAVLGFEPDELVGLDLSVLFTPEDHVHLLPNLLKMAARGREFSGEVMLVRKDGTRFFAFLSIKTYAETLETPPVLITGIRDIDRRKRMEQSFRDVGYEDLVKVANGIAHELRNPMVGIAGYVNKLYKSCRSDDEHDGYYRNILDDLKRIEELIRKVDFFIRMPKPQHVAEDLGRVIKEAVERCRREISECGAQLESETAECVLHVDREQVIRVVSILIDNALEAMGEGGSIRIRSSVEDGAYVISVQDTGPGISRDNLGHLFKPFFSTKSRGGRLRSRCGQADHGSARRRH